VGRHAGTFVESRIVLAKDSVKICSPWIGPKYAKLISNLVDRSVQVKIITTYTSYSNSSDEEEKMYGDTVDILRQTNISERASHRARDVKKERISYKIVKNALILAKMYVVDRKYAVAGSANFTYYGQTKNVEHLFYSDEPNEVNQLDRDFETIWSALKASETVEDSTSVMSSLAQRLLE
jgi:phosphatidylserine/phosphatidylglycerophosphate/cardiolipin synthase-like enzyme